jgi:hypothetical protein
LLTKNYVDTDKGNTEPHDILFSPDIKVVDLLEDFGLPVRDAQGATNQRGKKALPPLAVLIDLERYCLRVLNRLGEIKRTKFENLAMAMAKQRINAQFFGTDGDSISLPNMYQLFSFLSENGLYVLVQHVQLYMDTYLVPVAMPANLPTNVNNTGGGFWDSNRHNQSQVEAAYYQVEQQNIEKLHAIDTFQEQIGLILGWLKLYKGKQDPDAAADHKNSNSNSSSSSADRSDKKGFDFIDAMTGRLELMLEECEAMYRSLSQKVSDMSDPLESSHTLRDRVQLQGKQLTQQRGEQRSKPLNRSFSGYSVS